MVTEQDFFESFVRAFPNSEKMLQNIRQVSPRGKYELDDQYPVVQTRPNCPRKTQINKSLVMPSLDSRERKDLIEGALFPFLTVLYRQGGIYDIWRAKFDAIKRYTCCQGITLQLIEQLLNFNKLYAAGIPSFLCLSCRYLSRSRGKKVEWILNRFCLV